VALKKFKATKKDLEKMKDKRIFKTQVERMMESFSGMSGVKCEICKKETTQAQLSYSMRFYAKPLCRSCQRLESYKTSKGGDK
jgi:hypothetical protein